MITIFKNKNDIPGDMDYIELNDVFFNQNTASRLDSMASAIIEKDLIAGKLAEGVNADLLMILTSVEKVCINLGQETEEKLGKPMLDT